MDTSMEKINVNLYGGKGVLSKRETPLRAETVYCSCKDQCPLYAQGKCLLIQDMFTDNVCPFGKRQVDHCNYTSRSKKYDEFRAKYRAEEQYNKLTYPFSTRMVPIKDKVMFDLVYLEVSNEGVKREYRFGRRPCFIDRSALTLDFLYKIATQKVRAFMSDIEIEEYKKNIVPELLADVKKFIPELYEQFVEQHPEFVCRPTKIGKYAYLETFVDGSVIMDCHGNTATKRGDKLYCDCFRKGFIPFSGESAEVVITIKPRQLQKITNDDQWDDNTVFQ